MIRRPGDGSGGEGELSPALEIRGDLLNDVAPLRCRDCAKQATCPLYYDMEAEGLDSDDPANDNVDLCRLDKIIASQLVINDRNSAMAVLYEAINVKWQRVRRMIAFENMDGGMPDKAVSAELNEIISQIMYGMKPQVKVEQHFDLGQGESLLAKLFSKHTGAQESSEPPQVENTKATEKKVIDTEFTPDRTQERD